MKSKHIARRKNEFQTQVRGPDNQSLIGKLFIVTKLLPRVDSPLFLSQWPTSNYYRGRGSAQPAIHIVSTHLIRLETSSSAMFLPSIEYSVSTKTNTFGSVLKRASLRWSGADGSLVASLSVEHLIAGSGLVSRWIKLQQKKRGSGEILSGFCGSWRIVFENSERGGDFDVFCLTVIHLSELTLMKVPCFFILQINHPQYETLKTGKTLIIYPRTEPSTVLPRIPASSVLSFVAIAFSK